MRLLNVQVRLARRLVKVVGLLLLSNTSTTLAQASGSELFGTTCSPCHTINRGKLVGPDLAHVTERRSVEWISNFIKSSQAMVRAGDPEAVAIFNEYNKIVMPDQNLSDQQITSILEYIKSESSGSPGPVAATTGRPISEASSLDVSAGGLLFAGSLDAQHKLRNGGPTCNSCHQVNNSEVYAGGTLAKNLTDAFSRLGETGIRAILVNPPFPAMQQAYQRHPLTEEEIFSLIAFLQKVDEKKTGQTNVFRGMNFIYAGLGGVAVLLVFFFILRVFVKLDSINQAVFKRQVKTI